jgi:hypothetical protein
VSESASAQGAVWVWASASASASASAWVWVWVWVGVGVGAGLGALINTVTWIESTAPTALLTRTQYVDSRESAGVSNVADVAPVMGDGVWLIEPSCHW